MSNPTHLLKEHLIQCSSFCFIFSLIAVFVAVLFCFDGPFVALFVECLFALNECQILNNIVIHNVHACAD